MRSTRTVSTATFRYLPRCCRLSLGRPVVSVNSEHRPQCCRLGPAASWRVGRCTSSTARGRRFGTRLIGRGLLYSAVALLFTAGGVLIASNPALKSVWSAWSFETSPDSEHSTAEQSKQQLLNQHLINHAVSSKFRARGVYQEMRPYANVPPALKKRSLVSGALTEPGGLEVAPLIFYNDHELHMMFHAGSGLCGFVGLLHGGFIATVMDEGMARCAFESLPSGFGFTAHLAINYLKPLPQDSFYLLTAKKSKSQGRKVWVTGTIQKLQDKAAEDVVLVSADGLFIEPKFAKYVPHDMRRRIAELLK